MYVVRMETETSRSITWKDAPLSLSTKSKRLKSKAKDLFNMKWKFQQSYCSKKKKMEFGIAQGRTKCSKLPVSHLEPQEKCTLRLKTNKR